MKIKISGFQDERRQIEILGEFIKQAYDAKLKRSDKDGKITAWIEVRPPVKGACQHGGI